MKVKVAAPGVRARERVEEGEIGRDLVVTGANVLMSTGSCSACAAAGRHCHAPKERGAAARSGGQHTHE